jgi:hypothetical protein
MEDEQDRQQYHWQQKKIKQQQEEYQQRQRRQKQEGRHQQQEHLLQQGQQQQGRYKVTTQSRPLVTSSGLLQTLSLPLQQFKATIGPQTTSTNTKHYLTAASHSLCRFNTLTTFNDIIGASTQPTETYKPSLWHISRSHKALSGPYGSSVDIHVQIKRC